jgi:hypothetical protein
VQLAKLPDVGVPKSGVTSVGLVARTFAPEPVDVVTPVPPLETPKVPVIPVLAGRPVQLVSVPDVGVPKRGVTNVGLVAKTFAPEPVDVVTPVPPLETPSVPVIPVDSGSPVHEVSVPDVGVPSTGVTRVGEVFKTLAPEPVDVVTPVPPLETPSVPVVPVERGRPVHEVSTPAVGVPSAGVVKVGLVLRTTLPVPVLVVTPVPPDVTGRAFTNTASVAANNGVTSDEEYTFALVTFVPSLYNIADILGGIATPVPVEFLTVIASAHALSTM